MADSRVYILDTLSGEEASVEVFINGWKDGVTLFNSSGWGLKYLLQALGFKNVTLEYAENRGERNCILDKLFKLWKGMRCST